MAPAELFLICWRAKSTQCDAAPRIVQLERASIAVGVRHQVAAARQRSVALLRFVADEPDDAAGLAVKAAPETHHLELLGLRARQAQRGFDGLGAAAIEMRALEISRRDFREQLERLGAFRVGERADHQARGLFRERLRQSRMSMAEAGDRDAREEIDVDVAVGIGERRAFAVIDRDSGQQRNTLASRRDIALFGVEDFAGLRPGTGVLIRGSFPLLDTIRCDKVRCVLFELLIEPNVIEFKTFLRDRRRSELLAAVSALTAGPLQRARRLMLLIEINLAKHLS